MSANREAMLRVMRNHRRAAYGVTGGYEGLAIRPCRSTRRNCPEASLVTAAKRRLGRWRWRWASSTAIAMPRPR